MASKSQSETTQSALIDAKLVQQLIRQIPLTATQTAVLANGIQMVAHRGALRPLEAAEVAVYVDDTWFDTGQSERLQFMRRPLSPAHMLLVYPLRDGHRFIMVDTESAKLPEVRGAAQQILGVLAAAGISRDSSAGEAPAGEEEE